MINAMRTPTTMMSFSDSCCCVGRSSGCRDRVPFVGTTPAVVVGMGGPSPPDDAPRSMSSLRIKPEMVPLLLLLVLLLLVLGSTKSCCRKSSSEARPVYGRGGAERDGSMG